MGFINQLITGGAPPCKGSLQSSEKWAASRSLIDADQAILRNCRGGAKVLYLIIGVVSRVST